MCIRDRIWQWLGHVEEKKQAYVKLLRIDSCVDALKAAHICRRNLKIADRIVEAGRTEERLFDGNLYAPHARDGEFPVAILRLSRKIPSVNIVIPVQEALSYNFVSVFSR